MQPPEYPAILLSRSGSAISKLVQWVTDGKASHAQLWLPAAASIFESAPGVGVRALPFDSALCPNTEVYKVDKSFGPDYTKVLKFCLTELGKKYDWLGDWRFITRRNGSDTPTRWQCASFVFAALQAGGVQLLARVPAWKVSPEGLRRSTLLIGPQLQ